MESVALASLGKLSKCAIPSLLSCVKVVPSSNSNVTSAPFTGLPDARTATSTETVFPNVGSERPTKAKTTSPASIARNRMKNGNEGMPLFSIGFTKCS